MMVEIERASGVFLYGPDGKRYLDLISGIGVSNVGHCAPEVVAAIQEQSQKYLHTMVYGEFVLSPQVSYAEALCKAMGPGFDSVYFLNSGGEAVEAALKIAKKYTSRSKIVAMHNSYHGSTHGALSVTGSPVLKEGYGPFLPGIDFIHFVEEAGITKALKGGNSAEEPITEEKINRELLRITEETACVIIEPIQGEAGIVPPDQGWIFKLSMRCKETGTLLIFDEIQTGFGRTGTMFAFQSLGGKGNEKSGEKEAIIPDIVVLGKAMGGGLPLSGVFTRREVMQVISRDPVLGHISTFGGHPLSCAAGLAAFQKIENENLIAQIPEKEALIRKLLQHPKIKGLRGKGLMYAVQLDNFPQVVKVIKSCLEKGLITDWFLHCDSAIRIAPPLVITIDELKEGLGLLLESIDES